MANGWGGKRANSGRQKGTLNRRTQELIAKARERGVTPLEVMLQNMDFWNDQAEGMIKQLKDLAVDVTDVECLKELFGLIAKISDFRMKAQSCAVDAAPYMHPRLASVTVQGDANKPIQHIHSGQVSLKDAALAYNGTIADLGETTDEERAQAH